MMKGSNFYIAYIAFMLSTWMQELLASPHNYLAKFFLSETECPSGTADSTLMKALRAVKALQPKGQAFTLVGQPDVSKGKYTFYWTGGHIPDNVVSLSFGGSKEGVLGNDMRLDGKKCIYDMLNAAGNVIPKAGLVLDAYEKTPSQQ